MKDCSCSEYDLKFKHPFTCIISGPTGSGKSFYIPLLQNLNTLSTEPDFCGGIVRCYSEKTAVPTKELDKLKKEITYCHGMPTRFGHAQGLPSLIILDDLLNEAYSREVCVLFTKGSHRRNLSVILITQNLIQGRHCRDISRNAKYLDLLKTYVTKISFYI
jgi:ABC-type iron transport system FetAB ATPase subunit